MVTGRRFSLGVGLRRQEKRFNAEDTEIAEGTEGKKEKAPGSRPGRDRFRPPLQNRIRDRSYGFLALGGSKGMVRVMPSPSLTKMS
jgi:hypothetical protein